MIVSHAAVAPETYWKSVLPDTPMPKAVTDLLRNGLGQPRANILGVGPPRVSDHVGEPGASVCPPCVSDHVGEPGASVDKVVLPRVSDHVGEPGANVNKVGPPRVSDHVGEPGASIASVGPPRVSDHVGEPGASVDKVGPPRFSDHVGEPGSNILVVGPPRVSDHVGEPGASVARVGPPRVSDHVGEPGASVDKVGQPRISNHVGEPGVNVARVGPPRVSDHVGEPGAIVYSVGPPSVSNHVGEPGARIIGVGLPRVSDHVGEPGVSVHSVGPPRVSNHVGQPRVRILSVGLPHVSERVGQLGANVDSVGPPRISDHAGEPGSSVHTVGQPGATYETTDDHFKYDAGVALFFLERDMHQGHEMNLQFTKTISRSSTFLPRKVVDTIPFSSKSLPELNTRFSIKPDSIESESMKKTINLCEEKESKGEKKYCATSLESMVDFVMSKLGKTVKAISTEVNSNKVTPLQMYTIEGSKKLATNKFVACHKQNFPYAVFYCHKTTTTRAYSVSLVGEDGTKAKAVAICHKYAAKLYPKGLVFKVLKVKPGTAPICHFLPEDHDVWVPY